MKKKLNRSKNKMQSQNQAYYQPQYQQQQPQYQQRQPQYQQQQPQPTMPRPVYRSNPNEFRDAFFNFGSGFDMGIREDFDDPFDKFLSGGFGFGGINDMHKKMLGEVQNMMNMHGMIGDGKNMDQFNAPIGDNQGMTGMFCMKGAGPGTMISKSYCTRVDYSGGQPHEEKYQSQSINMMGKDGRKISEKQEAYKNTKIGIEKAAHQRLLDDRGVKQIRQRNINSGDKEEHNIYRGMQEADMQRFNDEFNSYKQQTNFQENYKYLNQMQIPRVNRLGDGRVQGQQRQGPQPLGLPGGQYK